MIVIQFKHDGAETLNTKLNGTVADILKVLYHGLINLTEKVEAKYIVAVCEAVIEELSNEAN